MKKSKYLSVLLAGLMLLQCLPLQTYADEPAIELEEAEKVVSSDPVEIIASGQCGDDISWQLYADGLLELTGTGDMWDGEILDKELKASATGLRIGKGITSIGYSAFSGCSTLTGTLTIPDSVTSIGYNAFGGCSGFTGSLVIPDGVVSIGKLAFSGCSGMTGSLILPDSIKEIIHWAFDGCKFTGSLILPKNLTSIGTGIFNNCSGFTGSLTVPDGVKSIGSSAFFGCSGLNDVLTLPASVTLIENKAFSGCENLTEIRFLGDVPTFDGTEIFTDMDSLTAIQVPAKYYQNYVTALATYVDTSLIVDNREYFTDAAMYTYNPEDGEYYNIDNRKLDREAQVIWLNETTASGYHDPSYSDAADSVYFADLESGWYDVILCGLGSYAESFPDDMEGKIAFCIRGDSTFSVKAENAMNAGAAFCIFGNNCRSAEAIDENGNVTGVYENVTPAMISCTVPAAVVSSDITVRLAAAAADISIAEAVAAVKEIYNGETEFRVSHAKPVRIFIGTEEEYRTALAAEQSRDINGDGVFDIDDALRLLRHTILPERYSVNVDNADFDGNGAVNTADALVLKKLLETPEEEPEEPADPYEGYEKWEGIYWKFDEDTQSLYIAGEGAVPAYPQSEYPWYEYRNVKMVEVVVEEGITELNASAIHLNRWTYSYLYLPSTLTYIDPVMLNVSGTSLKEIHVAEGSMYFTRDNVLYLSDKNDEVTLVTYPGGLKNTSFTVPADVDHIGEYSFSSKYLTSLEFPEGLQSIGAFAFRCCPSLYELEIPASVTYIHDLAFHYCEGLEKFIVAEGNPHYVSEEGVLFTAGMDTLFAYPINRSAVEYTVPDGVRCVLSPIAAMSSNLEVLYLPESVEEWQYLKGSNTPNVKLRAIYVDEANPCLTSENGILYKKDKSVLLQYPYAHEAEEYRMPDTVTVMQDGSVQDTAYLSSIWWGKNLADTGWMNELGASVKEIYFTGDVPTWLTNVCWRAASSATLYYPEGNTTWTDGTMTDGKYTFKTASYDPEAADPYEGYEEWEGIYWKFDASSATLFIAGEEEMPDFVASEYPWYDYRSQILTVDIGEGITDIPRQAVTEDYAVVQMKLPSTLENIDHTTFMYSRTLTDFEVTDGGKYYDVDGVLFSETDGVVTLECYPYGRREQEIIDSYTVPEGVTHLGLRAFNRSRIREIILPDSLVSIADHAIAWIYDLEKLHIPANVSSITQYSFWELYSLSEITVDEQNPFYEAVDGVLFDENVRVMYLYPLADRRTSYTVPDTVVTMPGEPISVTTNLKSIHIPASVRNIRLTLFSSGCSMESITVDSGNQYWSSADGVLYNGDGTILKYYPPYKPAEEFRIPDNVVKLESGAFYCPRYLKTLYIGKNLSTVVHTDFDNLDKVYFPGDVPEWLNNMFGSVCGKVTLYYPEGNTTWTDGTMTVNGYTYKTAAYDPDAEESVPDDGYAVFENIRWKFDEAAGTLYIAGEGDMPDLASSEYPWSTLGYSVTDLIVEEGITSLTKNSMVTVYPYRVQYPSTLESTGQAFMRLNNQRLNGYTVAEGGRYYAVNGVLFSADGNVRILEHMPYSHEDQQNYVIPEGTTHIADYAMIYMDAGLENVTFPESLESIGYRSFGYSGIRSVTLGMNVSHIDPASFVGCTEVTAYTVNADNPYFMTEDGILYSADKTDMIAYPYSNGVTEFTIPDGVTEVPLELLYYSVDLQVLNIPASVTSIISEGGSYDTLSALKQVNVSADNTVYSSEDGVLYSADKQRLIYYPTCKTEKLYVIPSAVRYVNGWAIFGNQHLTSLVISSSVISMEPATNPRNCYNLTDIYFTGELLKYWNNGDFRYLTNLDRITLHYPEDAAGWTSGTWTSSTGYTFSTASYEAGTTPWTTP